MEGLNKQCICPCTWLRPWISKHTWVKFNRSQLVQVEAQELKIPNQWGITHIKKVRTNCHTFDPLFSPLTSAKNPCFYQKDYHPKSYFFHTVQNFGKFSLKDPKSAGVWEKGTQIPPFFMAFVTGRPPIFCPTCTCLRGMFLPQTQSGGKFCILETRIVQAGEYF